MRKQQKTKFIRTEIAERFPVFYGHVNQGCKRANDPKTEGPFYAAGSEWFEIFTPPALVAANSRKEHLAKDGYTVSVCVVER